MDCISPIIYFLTLTATQGQQLKKPKNSWKIAISRNEVKKSAIYITKSGVNKWSKLFVSQTGLCTPWSNGLFFFPYVPLELSRY